MRELVVASSLAIRLLESSSSSNSLPHHTMTSLADELMNDLDDLGSGSDVDDELDSAMAGPSGATTSTSAPQADGDDNDDGEPGDVDEALLGGAAGEVHVPEGGVRPADEVDPEAVNAMDLAGVAEVGKVARLQGSRTMREVLQVRPVLSLACALPVRLS